MLGFYGIAQIELAQVPFVDQTPNSSGIRVTLRGASRLNSPTAGTGRIGATLRGAPRVKVS
jgi:hypothetical protein